MAPLRRKPQGMSIRKPAWFAWRVFLRLVVRVWVLGPEVLRGRRLCWVAGDIRSAGDQSIASVAVNGASVPFLGACIARRCAMRS